MTMRLLVAVLFVLVLLPASAQPGAGQPRGMRQMPPPERRLSWEERQRLREQVRHGSMTRDEARQRWQEQRERRSLEQGRSPEEREKMRRDVQDANRALDRR